MSEQSIYKLHDEAFITVDRKNGNTKIIKLTDDNYYFQLNLIASEIAQGIDGMCRYDEVLTKVAAGYDPRHSQEIREKGLELLQQLLHEQLIIKK